jgi:hypothetical protein
MTEKFNASVLETPHFNGYTRPFQTPKSGGKTMLQRVHWVGPLSRGTSPAVPSFDDPEESCVFAPLSTVWIAVGQLWKTQKKCCIVSTSQQGDRRMTSDDFFRNESSMRINRLAATYNPPRDEAQLRLSYMLNILCVGPVNVIGNKPLGSFR